MTLIEKTDIKDLINRANLLITWLEENVFHPDFYKAARGYAALTVKISNYYKINKV